MQQADFNITIIGGGVIGLAIADRLSGRHKNILLLEKYSMPGMAITARNSQVIHSGIYYPPNTLKSRLCIEGREMIYHLCEKHQLPHRRITKLIVATADSELEKLEGIYKNGLNNNVETTLLTEKQVTGLEPNVMAKAAIFCEQTGIIDAHSLVKHFYNGACSRGVTVQFNSEVFEIEKGGSSYKITTREGGESFSFTSAMIINAAGLYADHISAMAGVNSYEIHFCKGDYFSLAPSKHKLINRLIYPVPPNEGLGIHSVTDMGGGVTFGPDVEYLNKNTEVYGVSELKQKTFYQAVSRYIRGIEQADLSPAFAGIRPKLQKQGEKFKDFVILRETEAGHDGLINLIGIESPGLTASPAIAKMVDNLI